MFGQRNDVYLNLHLRLTRPLAHQELALEDDNYEYLLISKEILAYNFHSHASKHTKRSSESRESSNESFRGERWNAST